MPEQIDSEHLRQLRELLDKLTAAAAGEKTYTILVDAPEVSSLPMVLRLEP